MNIRIIQLGINHLKACIELDQKSLKGLWSKSQWESELSGSQRICIGAMDLDSKKLLGLCSAWLVIDELQITSLAVLPKYQRKGLGKFLLSEIITFSKSFQTNQIHLEVKETNEQAKAFYQSMGFKIKGKRPNFYKDGSDALILNKHLNNKS
tara:strand:- start:24 stop:479 length:456 start_codon:yes stop_codon:yes gene_type:complete